MTSILGARRALLLSSVPFVALALASGTAQAQSADSAASAPSDEILVTARKRGEDILKTPISVTALTSEAIEARGIQSINDLSDYTPSLKIVTSSSGRNDRSFQQIIVRGFTPSSSLIQTTSMFIDGVPISSSTGLQTIASPERIEVLKGPQSAYFGRQTFAGAVNVVTKTAPDYLEASVTGMIGTRDNHELKASIGGPLIEGLVGFRASVQETARGGSWENQGVPGQMLGDQRTRAGTLAVEFTPAPNFTAKVFGLISENDDGPNATGFLSAYELRDPSGAVIVPDSSNCTFGSNPYFCGTLPGLPAGTPSTNTVDSPYIQDFLANPQGRVIDPKNGPDGYGLLARFYHLHMALDWDVGSGITLSSLTGYNNERRSQLSDLDLYYNTTIPNSSNDPGARDFYDYPYLVEAVLKDFSQEVRASYDDGGPFTATVGGSYLNATYHGAGGGSPGGLGTTRFSIVSGKTRNRTFGAFFGLGYEITPELSINFDGRYQIDTMYAYAQPTGITIASDAFAPEGYYEGGSLLAKETYRNFTPRVIVNYDVTPEMMVYASYSRGVNPAAFNTVFLSNLSAQAQQLAADAGLRVAVEPETLDNFEIGAKGRLFGNRLRYSLAAWYGIWDNQLNANVINLIDPADNQVYNLQAQLNTGKVDMYGLEAELSFALDEHLTLGANGSYNDSDIQELSAPTVTGLTGITDFSGKHNPLASRYSASASVDYRRPVGKDVEAFARADFTYKSGVYTNASNLTKTPNMTQVNVRLGFGNDNFRLEGFVTNLFNNKAYPNAIDFSLLDSTFQYLSANAGVAVALRELRTFGLRSTVNF
ncbi:TonB-dependent receptor [Novosphingobium profundi]|uniref:TonB-dependent receptor n=1 Tax=Novosphingobium profundi TaxID=1774954 RepID=UPI001CFDB595|nr:TonB-dependent receptor [Novosphingobium profundi]